MITTWCLGVVMAATMGSVPLLPSVKTVSVAPHGKPGEVLSVKRLRADVKAARRAIERRQQAAKIDAREWARQLEVSMIQEGGLGRETTLPSTEAMVSSQVREKETLTNREANSWREFKVVPGFPANGLTMGVRVKF